jgi:predicted HicB family RNase H-like nuclease
MPDENRIPLFVRVPATLKDRTSDAAWRQRLSVSRFVEEAIRDRLRRVEEEPAEAG